VSASSPPDRSPAIPRLLILYPAIGACLLLLAACGGGGGDLTGTPKVPKGYDTFRGEGVSFVYPRGWKVAQSRDPRGAPSVDITPPQDTPSPTGLIRFSILPGAGARFESLADQRRVVIKTVNDGKIESDEEVELAGATKALQVRSSSPPRRGTDPVPVKARSLDVLRKGGDVLEIVAAAPQRKGETTVDPDAVISSFRLTGS
jgi:hypothetical protein